MRVKYYPTLLGYFIFVLILAQSALAGDQSTTRFAAGGILKAPAALTAAQKGQKVDQVEVASNGAEEISTFDECSRVQNKHAKGVFVPLKSRKEWTRFKQQPPQNVSLGQCNKKEPVLPIPEDDVKNKCSGSKKERIVKVHFPNPSRSCSWNQNGNFKAKNTYFSGRIEQEVGIDLPETSVLCGAEFTFNEQKFWYDDVFVMSLNDNVLASSYKWDGILDQTKGFFQYDWNKIAGKSWYSGVMEATYCPSDVDKDGNPLPVSLTTCTFPQTQKTGKMKLNVSPDMMMKAMSNSGQKNHKLKFVTIGDNDSTDCQHFDFEFSMKVSYVD